MKKKIENNCFDPFLLVSLPGMKRLPFGTLKNPSTAQKYTEWTIIYSLLISFSHCCSIFHGIKRVFLCILSEIFLCSAISCFSHNSSPTFLLSNLSIIGKQIEGWCRRKQSLSLNRRENERGSLRAELCLFIHSVDSWY